MSVAIWAETQKHLKLKNTYKHPHQITHVMAKMRACVNLRVSFGIGMNLRFRLLQIPHKWTASKHREGMRIFFLCLYKISLWFYIFRWENNLISAPEMNKTKLLKLQYYYSFLFFRGDVFLKLHCFLKWFTVSKRSNRFANHLIQFRVVFFVYMPNHTFTTDMIKLWLV